MTGSVSIAILSGDSHEFHPHPSSLLQSLTANHRRTLSVQSYFKSMVWVIEKGCALAFPNVLNVTYGQFHEITDASWHIQPTRLINLKDLGLSAAREREEHQCQNVNGEDLLEEPEEGHACKMRREGNLK